MKVVVVLLLSLLALGAADKKKLQFNKSLDSTFLLEIKNKNTSTDQA